jgi:hypothetical protein
MSKEIIWQKSLKNASESAGAQGKLLLVDFYGPT